MKRREFLSSTLVAVGGLSVLAEAVNSNPPKEASSPGTLRGEMLYRPLGKTGVEVSAVGLGGHHIGRVSEEAESIRLIRTAVDRGITFMDNCWDYHDGKSELWMGNALQDGYRKKVFLMTKTDSRSKQGTLKQIDESLRRLKTDYLDLVQIHEIIRLEDPDLCFRENGAVEGLKEAKRAGKVRFIGFTGHKDPYVFVRMLESAKKHGFPFDTLQMPLNVMDAHFRSFEKDVVPIAQREGIAIIGMKALGDGHLLKSGTVTAIECLHYALDLPTSVVVTGIESHERLDQAFQAAKTFRPLAKAEVESLLARTEKAAKTGRHEPFKTSAEFDGTAKHPEWMA